VRVTCQFLCLQNKNFSSCFIFFDVALNLISMLVAGSIGKSVDVTVVFHA